MNPDRGVGRPQRGEQDRILGLVMGVEDALDERPVVPQGVEVRQRVVGGQQLADSAQVASQAVVDQEEGVVAVWAPS